MSQFNFRLRSVLQLRERHRDEAAQSYQQALLAIRKLDEQIEQLLQEHAAQKPYQAASSTGDVSPQKLLESQRYQMHLLQEVRELHSQKKLVEAESEKRRLVLVEREKDVRSIEKLHGRQLAQWHDDEARRQQIALDQWAGFQYWESSREKPHGDDGAPMCK